MKKLHWLIIGVAVLALAFVAVRGAMAHGNEHGQVKATAGGAKITIEYNRPMLKGRDLAKMLQPGQVWRIGADSPTTLETDRDLDFGGTRVPRGKHILLARLIEAGKWSLVFSTKPAREYNPQAKVAEVPLELEPGKDSVEMVTIQLSENGVRGVIEIAWGTMRLRASFAPAK